MSCPVSYGILNTFCCVMIRCVTVFDGVDPILLRMSRYVTVITACEVYRYKMAYHGDKFLHIGAVTIVNNRDQTLHYAIEEEIKSRTFFINSGRAVIIISKAFFVYKRQKSALNCMVSIFRP